MSKNTADPRHLSRLLAVQYLFTNHFAKKNNQEINFFETNDLLEETEQKKYNRELYEDIVEGVTDKVNDLDKKIQELAPAWPLNQINTVDLIILRAAVWESVYYEDTPPKVVINEAVELAKEMGNQSNGNFVNGVLGSLLDTKIKDA